MTKKRVEKPHREYTRRQLARWQRQKRIQRIITIAGALVIAAVLGIVLTGWYLGDYQPRHQTIVRVNETEFDMDYFVKMLSFYGQGTSSAYLPLIADNVVETIQQDELIRQETLKLGITVSQDEVDEKLKEYDPPLGKDYRDIARAEMLVGKLFDEHFEKEVPLSTAQRHVLAMYLESQSQAAEVREKLSAGEYFPWHASQLSLEAISRENNGDLGWHPEEIFSLRLGTSVPVEYAFSAEAGALSPPLYDEETAKNIGYWLIKVLERDEETAHVQAMLLGSEAEGLVTKARLEAGEDFAELARELSQDDLSREAGGDMGWLEEGIMSPAFDAFAFDPEVAAGTLSDPVADDTAWTTGGYWLVKVEEIDEQRQLDDDDRYLLKNQALSDWITALWEDPENEVESYLDDAAKGWAIEHLPAS